MPDNNLTPQHTQWWQQAEAECRNGSDWWASGHLPGRTFHRDGPCGQKAAVGCCNTHTGVRKGHYHHVSQVGFGCNRVGNSIHIDFKAKSKEVYYVHERQRIVAPVIDLHGFFHSPVWRNVRPCVPDWR